MHGNGAIALGFLWYRSWTSLRQVSAVHIHCDGVVLSYVIPDTRSIPGACISAPLLGGNALPNNMYNTSTTRC